MKRLDKVLNEHVAGIDSIVSEFTDALEGMIERARKALVADLQDKLVIENGFISSTARNQKLLADLDAQFLQFLNNEGYQELLDNYVKSFNGQFEWFTQVLNTLSSQLVYPLPEVKYTPGQLAEFQAFQAGSRDLLEGVIEKVAARAKQQIVLSAGAMESKELAKHLSEVLGTSVGESESLADTSISTFYRTISDAGYQMIEEDLPGFKIRYNYDGPLDKLNRPFCIKLVRQSRGGKTWTRAEIDKMSNGQIPNVFTTCGGYRCRHQWAIAISDMNRQQASKGRPRAAGPRQHSRASVEREVSAHRTLSAQKMQVALAGERPSVKLAEIHESVKQQVADIRRATNARG